MYDSKTKFHKLWCSGKFGRIEDVAKLFFGIAVLLGIVNTQLLRKSDLDVAIAISFSLFGAFAFGVYPLGKN